MSNADIELESITAAPPAPSPSRDTAPETGEDRTELAPVDRGPRAWMLLCAAFVFEALLWGFPLSFGVFQEYYSNVPEFAGNRYISVVGTIASGFGYLGAPIIMPVIQRWQRRRRQMIVVGWSICILGLVAGSFATTLEALILTQGVAYGLGFLIFDYPILSMVDEYWVARRGMAYGLLCGASVALAVLTAPFIPLLKGRSPASVRTTAPTTSWSFFGVPLFWVYSVSNLLQGFGYFFPSLYLPSYASSLGLGGNNGALLIALMSVSQVAGQFVFGVLSDHTAPVNLLACLSTVVAAVACFTLWKLAESLPVLVVFAMVYGFFAAGFTATWARMSTAITDDVSGGPIVFTLLNFGKGIGNVAAGPIGGSLISAAKSAGSSSSSPYELVVVFTGVSMFASALTICLRSAKYLIRHRWAMSAREEQIGG
ncbi:major facilitator superfamily domain-containing protein [Xylariaceae sp. FL1272]|nr:major facilitator superfamily domain-containing protein [Xylariaceae sp. FL1272]